MWLHVVSEFLPQIVDHVWQSVFFYSSTLFCVKVSTAQHSTYYKINAKIIKYAFKNHNNRRFLNERFVSSQFVKGLIKAQRNYNICICIPQVWKKYPDILQAGINTTFSQDSNSYCTVVRNQIISQYNEITLRTSWQFQCWRAKECVESAPPAVSSCPYWIGAQLYCTMRITMLTLQCNTEKKEACCCALKRL